MRFSLFKMVSGRRWSAIFLNCRGEGPRDKIAQYSVSDGKQYPYFFVTTSKFGVPFFYTFEMNYKEPLHIFVTINGVVMLIFFCLNKEMSQKSNIVTKWSISRNYPSMALKDICRRFTRRKDGWNRRMRSSCMHSRSKRRKVMLERCHFH